MSVSVLKFCTLKYVVIMLDFVDSANSQDTERGIKFTRNNAYECTSQHGINMTSNSSYELHRI